MSDTTPQQPSSTSPPSIPALEKFIFKPDIFSADIIPRKLSPPDVARFLTDKVEKTIKLKSAYQVEKVTDFYDTHEVTDRFKQFLDGKEANEEDIRRSAVFARIIAKVGKPEERDFARQYYAHLVKQANTKPEFEDLLKLYDALDGGDANILRDRIVTKMKALEPRIKDDYQASVEYNEFEEIRGYKLVRAEQANKTKDKILKLADRNQRIDEEVKMYLSIGYGYLEFLQPWAARRIRRETYSAEVEQQLTRVDQPPLNEDVVKAFRRILETLGQFITRDGEKETARIRSLRAILFFNGKVTGEEREFLNQFTGEQTDILSNEGAMLPKPS